jgi:hypothetical protein
MWICTNDKRKSKVHKSAYIAASCFQDFQLKMMNTKAY